MNTLEVTASDNLLYKKARQGTTTQDAVNWLVTAACGTVCRTQLRGPNPTAGAGADGDAAEDSPTGSPPEVYTLGGSHPFDKVIYKVTGVPDSCNLGSTMEVCTENTPLNDSVQRDPPGPEETAACDDSICLAGDACKGSQPPAPAHGAANDDPDWLSEQILDDGAPEELGAVPATQTLQVEQVPETQVLGTISPCDAAGPASPSVSVATTIDADAPDDADQADVVSSRPFASPRTLSAVCEHNALRPQQSADAAAPPAAPAGPGTQLTWQIPDSTFVSGATDAVAASHLMRSQEAVTSSCKSRAPSGTQPPNTPSARASASLGDADEQQPLATVPPTQCLQEQPHSEPRQRRSASQASRGTVCNSGSPTEPPGCGTQTQGCEAGSCAVTQQLGAVGVGGMLGTIVDSQKSLTQNRGDSPRSPARGCSQDAPEAQETIPGLGARKECNAMPAVAAEDGMVHEHEAPSTASQRGRCGSERCDAVLPPAQSQPGPSAHTSEQSRASSEKQRDVSTTEKDQLPASLATVVGSRSLSESGARKAPQGEGWQSRRCVIVEKPIGRPESDDAHTVHDTSTDSYERARHQSQERPNTAPPPPQDAHADPASAAEAAAREGLNERAAQPRDIRPAQVASGNVAPATGCAHAHRDGSRLKAAVPEDVAHQPSDARPAAADGDSVEDAHARACFAHSQALTVRDSYADTSGGEGHEQRAASVAGGNRGVHAPACRSAGCETAHTVQATESSDKERQGPSRSCAASHLTPATPGSPKQVEGSELHNAAGISPAQLAAKLTVPAATACKPRGSARASRGAIQATTAAKRHKATLSPEPPQPQGTTADAPEQRRSNAGAPGRSAKVQRANTPAPTAAAAGTNAELPPSTSSPPAASAPKPARRASLQSTGETRVKSARERNAELRRSSARHNDLIQKKATQGSSGASRSRSTPAAGASVAASNRHKARQAAATPSCARAVTPGKAPSRTPSPALAARPVTPQHRATTAERPAPSATARRDTASVRPQPQPAQTPPRSGRGHTGAVAPRHRTPSPLPRGSPSRIGAMSAQLSPMLAERPELRSMGAVVMHHTPRSSPFRSPRHASPRPSPHVHVHEDVIAAMEPRASDAETRRAPSNRSEHDERAARTHAEGGEGAAKGGAEHAAASGHRRAGSTAARSERSCPPADDADDVDIGDLDGHVEAAASESVPVNDSQFSLRCWACPGSPGSPLVPARRSPARPVETPRLKPSPLKAARSPRRESPPPPEQPPSKRQHVEARIEAPAPAPAKRCGVRTQCTPDAEFLSMLEPDDESIVFSGADAPDAEPIVDSQPELCQPRPERHRLQAARSASTVLESQGTQAAVEPPQSPAKLPDATPARGRDQTRAREDCAASAAAAAPSTEGGAATSDADPGAGRSASPKRLTAEDKRQFFEIAQLQSQSHGAASQCDNASDRPEPASSERRQTTSGLCRGERKREALPKSARRGPRAHLSGIVTSRWGRMMLASSQNVSTASLDDSQDADAVADAVHGSLRGDPASRSSGAPMRRQSPGAAAAQGAARSMPHLPSVRTRTPVGNEHFRRTPGPSRSKSAPSGVSPSELEPTAKALEDPSAPSPAPRTPTRASARASGMTTPRLSRKRPRASDDEDSWVPVAGRTRSNDARHTPPTRRSKRLEGKEASIGFDGIESTAGGSTAKQATAKTPSKSGATPASKRASESATGAADNAPQQAQGTKAQAKKRQVTRSRTPPPRTPQRTPPCTPCGQAAEQAGPSTAAHPSEPVKNTAPPEQRAQPQRTKTLASTPNAPPTSGALAPAAAVCASGAAGDGDGDAGELDFAAAAPTTSAASDSFVWGEPLLTSTFRTSYRSVECSRLGVITAGSVVAVKAAGHKRDTILVRVEALWDTGGERIASGCRLLPMEDTACPYLVPQQPGFADRCLALMADVYTFDIASIVTSISVRYLSGEDAFALKGPVHKHLKEGEMLCCQRVDKNGALLRLDPGVLSCDHPC